MEKAVFRILNYFKAVCLLILLICIPRQMCAQQTTVDSLLKVLKSAPEDTSTVNLLNNLFKEYQNDDPTKALKYSKQALELAAKLGFQRGIASSYNNIGFACFNNGNANDALDNYLKALEIFNDIGFKKGSSITLANIGNLFYSQGNYPKTIEYYLQSLSLAQEGGDKQRSASLLGNIGIAYYNQGYYAKALGCYMNSLAIREDIGDKQGIAYVLGNIGMIYDDQKNYTKSLEYYEKSLKIKQEIGDKKGIANTLGNIGMVYNNQKDYTKALDYFQKALALSTEINYKQLIASSLSNIGDVYKVQEKYTKASEYFTKTLEINQKLGDKQGISYSYNNIGDIFRIIGNNENALLYFNKSLAVAKEIGLKELMKDNYQKISETYASMENYLQAYKYHKLYSIIKDSIYTEESIKQIADMQAKYETEKQEKEINLLKKESELQSLKISRWKMLIFYISGILLLIIVLASLIFYAYRQIKKAKLALENEKQKSDSLLLNILPHETAEELKSKGYSTVKDYEHVTVMFTDFVNFTGITEKLTPVELIGKLNMFFIRFDEIIGKYDIEKIKTIGDAYMCAGGLPHQDRENPKKIILAALEIQQFVNEYNEEKLKKNEPLWEIRIGIHTGDIIAGVVGKKKFAYDIWGDTVNIASRMESSGESGKINISGYTYEHVKEYFDCGYRGKICAKNKKENIDMYFVNDIKRIK